MKYKSFIIERYKAITSTIAIDLDKNRFVPIIGINECGKTTILNSIFAFDHTNDSYSSTINHLNDVYNLYETTEEPAIITAEITIDENAFKKTYRTIHKEINEKTGVSYTPVNLKLPAGYQFPTSIRITREISSTSTQYSISHKELSKGMDTNEFCKRIVNRMPYILYFDDFKDSFPDKIEIKSTGPDKSHWLDIIEELFKKTDKNYSIYKLAEIEKRRRNNILTDVSKKLNETLTKEWANFRLDDRDSLQISIDFDIENTPSNDSKNFLLFVIAEKNPDGLTRTFYVRDRSKGFYWFFNFVMKLEFNPKVLNGLDKTIYLLDEPGSYLHPFAQNKLCKKLVNLSNENNVFYCTHTHYLLDPDIIPLNSIHIAQKSNFGEITLERFDKYERNSLGMQTAFQPIYDALYLKPFGLDFSYKKILVVEGIYDYYSFMMFRRKDDYGIMPGRGADSIVTLISTLLGFNREFKILWDNDAAGEIAQKNAIKYFGEEFSANHFFSLPSKSGKKRILQDLYDGNDIKLIKEQLSLSQNTSFNKVIAALFFSSKKQEIIKLISNVTKNHFNEVLTNLKYD